MMREANPDSSTKHKNNYADAIGERENERHEEHCSSCRLKLFARHFLKTYYKHLFKPLGTDAKRVSDGG